jgi:hypothetical protein
LRDLAALGQRTPLDSHTLQLTTQLDLFHKKRISSGAIRRALIRKMSRIGGDKLRGG